MKLHDITEDLLFEYGYLEYVIYVEKTKYLTESTELYEISSGLKQKLAFIKNIASTIKARFTDLLKLFQKKKVFKFFSKIKWSLDYLFGLAKKGLKIYRTILNAISEFVAKSKVGKWTEDKLKELDSFLEKHPKIKRIAGIGVAALLIYIWLNMTFTGDFGYDFDMSDMIAALAGKFSLSQLFAGPAGIKLLLLFATGAIGLSFPWPGAQSKQFVGAVVGTLAKKFKQKIKKSK